MAERLHLLLLARSQFYCRIYYYFRCPYPVDGLIKPYDCFNADCCGCSNALRFRARSQPEKR